MSVLRGEKEMDELKYITTTMYIGATTDCSKISREDYICREKRRHHHLQWPGDVEYKRKKRGHVIGACCAVLCVISKAGR